MAGMRSAALAAEDSGTATSSRPSLSEDRRALLVGLLLLLATLLAFVPVLGYGFVDYDDPVYVTDNLHVRSGISVDGVVWAFSSFVSSNYHPLTVLSHMLDCQLFGLEPRGHHLTSLLLHLASTLLVFEVLRRMTGDLAPSAFVAAVFALHPLRLEPVAWIADRKDLLSGFFSIVALAAYLAYVRRPSWARYVAVAAATLGALLAKATAVTLPGALLLLDLWPLGRIPRDSWRAAARALPRLVAEKLPLLALAAGVGALATVAQGSAWMPVATLSWPHRVANALVSYATYLGQTLVPRGLAVFYPHVEIPVWKAAAAGALFAALTALAVAAWRRAPYLTVGWLWFAGTLVPVLGLTQVGNQAMADRYTYVSGLGLTIAAAWGLAAAAGSSAAARRGLAVAGVAAVLALAAATRVQARHWRDSVTLFRHALAVTAPNVVAHLNLAEGLREAGDLDAAVEHYRAALALEPTRVEAVAGLGMARRAQGRLEEALAAMRRAAELAPDDARVHHALASVLDDAGRTDEAILHLEKAIELDPGQIVSHLGLADLLARKGEPERARQHLEKAMALDRR